MTQITDTHVFHDLNCPARMRAFLASFGKVSPAPDVILHSGDIIFDAVDADRDQVTRQWTLWDELARALPTTPVYAIGNHDIWGKGPASDPLYGKKWMVDRFKLPNRFYSVSKGGWRFIVLDSTQPMPNGGWYTSGIDEEQRDWLTRELASTPATMPIVIVSHIPLLSAAVLHWAKVDGGDWTFSTQLMHSDSHDVQALLRPYANVKVCVSGHVHLLDHVTLDGITYMGCGAVAGNWWKGDAFHQTHCGFATLDLYADGSFERTYHAYAWPADAR